MSIIGKPLSAPPAVPDWDEQDSSAGGFIRNKPDFLLRTGGTMTGDLSMGGNAVTDVKAPEKGTDAANKSYVDNKVKTYADSKYYSVTATLVAESWVGKVQSVTVSGVVADEEKVDVYASPTSEASNYEVYAECGVRVLGQGANTVIFTCEDVPADDLTVNIAVVIKGSPVIGGEYEDGDGIAYG